MQEVSVDELKDKIDNKEDFVLVDVREQNEFDICSLGGLEIPMSQIMTRYQEIPKDKPVIIHCKSGKRSANVISALEQNFGYDNLSNLEGGILAWADEIDPEMDRY
ncbi:MAG: rhodanese-like domain-containing protein [Flavobacteriales bacterium]|jgi:rhodanese-related sulfurtransferase|nr:rhodanese-like domain-containing protein [Flavobacteriales bacterium]